MCVSLGRMAQDRPRLARRVACLSRGLDAPPLRTRFTAPAWAASFVFTGHSPWPQGLRRDLECLSFLIDFLRRPHPKPDHFRAYGANPLQQIARSSSGIRRGKPAFTSRIATAFSDHKAAHVTMHYSAADWCCSAALKGALRQLSSDECRQVMTESGPRYHSK
jgi:hypothetical protein